jgi:hypothetical protein
MRAQELANEDRSRNSMNGTAQRESLLPACRR